MNKLIKSKRAQFYILTAIILISVSTLLLQPRIITPKASKAFSNIYDDFAFESNSAINTALRQGASPVSETQRFVDSFISYAKTKKMKLEIFSILVNSNTIYAYSRMNSEVLLITQNYTLIPNSTYSFSSSGISELVLRLKDDVFFENIYKFSLNSQKTQHYAVLRLKKGKDSEVFVKS